MNVVDTLPLASRAGGRASYPQREPDPAAAAEAWLDRQTRRGASEVFSIIVDLTPALASALLARNPDNRGVRSRVAEMQRDMESGRWQMNGEPIIVSVCGQMNDGQHRCEAVVKSGATIRVLMVFGVERETRYSVDTGVARTPGDFLQMRGIAQANNVAAAAGYLWQIEQFGRVPDTASIARHRPTKQQLQEVAVRLGARIRASMDAVPMGGAKKIAGYAQLVAVHAYLAEIVGDDRPVTEFMRALVAGDKRDDRDAVWIARERLMEEKRKRHVWPAKTMEVVIRAWNFHRRGARTGKIQIMGEWPKIAR